MATVKRSCDSLVCVLGHLGEIVLGLVLFILGVGLMFTLWLMPVGLPLALFGAALMGAGGDL